MAWINGQWVDEDELQGMLYQNPLASLGGSSFTGPLSTLTRQATGYGTPNLSMWGSATPTVGGYDRGPDARWGLSRDTNISTGLPTIEGSNFTPGYNPTLDASIINESMQSGNFQGETLAGPTVNQFRPTGSDYTPQQLSTPIDQLQQQNIPSNVVPLFDPTAGLAASDPNLQGVTPFSQASTSSLGTFFPGEGDNVSNPGQPGLFPWGPGTVTDDQTSNTVFRPGFGTLRDSYAPQPEDDAGDDFFGDGDVTGAEPAFEMFRPGEDLGMVDPTWADSGGWGVPQETVSLPEILSYAAPLPALGLLGKIPAVGKALTSAEKAMRRNLLKGAAGVAALGAAGKLGPGAINRALDLAKTGGVETFKDIGVKTVSILDEFGKTIGFKNVIAKGPKKGQKSDPTLKDNIQVRSKKGTDKTPYDWAGAPIGASVAEIVSNAKTAPTGNLERIAARRSSELARQQQAAADKRAADRLAAQQAQEAAAQAQAASAAQAQAAQNAARAVLASAAGRDRGGPSSREIAAAIEVLSGVDSFGSGGMRNTRGEVGMDETGYTDTSGYGVG